MANNIELLIDLGVNKESSKVNINNYIKQLKNLETVKVELEISGIKAYQDTVKKLQSQLGNTKLNLNTGGGNLKSTVSDTLKAQNATKGLNNEIVKAKTSTDGFVSSFTKAMTKFPVWMAASTVFYQSITGISDLTSKVIELDTAITNMRRVMDVPEHKFNEMLEKSISNVTELSGKLGDYLTLVSEFGRMGYNDVESLDLSNTAQSLTSISDLTASESVSSLVAAMISFNIEAKDSIKIADKLNEVDNNFAITTKDLSQSMNKAASTAATFGVELETLIGHTTAKILAFVIAILRLNFSKQGNSQ